jgi:hypothetical protein
MKPELAEPLPDSGSSGSAARALTNRPDGRNPFSVSVLREAAQNLGRGATKETVAPNAELKNAAATADAFSPTHYYVRLKPASTDELAELGDLGIELSYQPLDENAAASYHSRSTTTDIPWVYTAVPAYYALPAQIRFYCM